MKRNDKDIEQVIQELTTFGIDEEQRKRLLGWGWEGLTMREQVELYYKVHSIPEGKKLGDVIDRAHKLAGWKKYLLGGNYRPRVIFAMDEKSYEIMRNIIL